jgi:large subunit ribosomal protein L6
MPVKIPAGVQVSVEGGKLIVKGTKTSLSFAMPANVTVEVRDGVAAISQETVKNNTMIAGTVRAHLNNMVNGVTKGYERKLMLVGVGYRAQAQGKKVNLSLGFSHPVEYPIPEGITVETPTQTEIVIKGASRHMVGPEGSQEEVNRVPHGA